MTEAELLKELTDIRDALREIRLERQKSAAERSKLLADLKSMLKGDFEQRSIH
jgi:hypothetical protein